MTSYICSSFLLTRKRSVLFMTTNMHIELCLSVECVEYLHPPSTADVHLFYKPGYVTSCIGNCIEEKPCVRMSGFPAGI
jgi:hypothetical protein